jgi:hypothetical protein
MPALWSMGVKADKAIATYRRMRAQPLWRLLASTTGPTVIGLLQSHLYESTNSAFDLHQSIRIVTLTIKDC